MNLIDCVTDACQLLKKMKNYKMKCERYLNESAFRTFFVLNSKKCTKQEGGET